MSGIHDRAVRSGASLSPTRARRAKGSRGRRDRVGLSIIYLGLMFVALIGFVSLAVDIGRVRLAREQIQTAADAAARAGADTLPIGTSQTVIDTSSTTAASNEVTGKIGADYNPPLTLVPSDDIEFGTWNPNNRTFTVIEANAGARNDPRRAANAVHVIGRRTEARGTPIKLAFAPVVGVFSSDIEREATAYVTGGPDKFGFIGLDWVRSTGNTTTIDSVLPPSTTRRDNGWVGSNGNIDLGNADVYGDVRPGVGQTITQGPQSDITGWQAPLDYPLVYPADTFKAPLTNNNASITPVTAINGTKFAPKGKVNCNFPANGAYVFSKAGAGSAWTANNGTTTINAPADIYIDGDFTMTGTGTLKIVATGTQIVRFFVDGSFNQTGGTIVNTGNASNLYIDVTQAKTSVTLSGTGTEKAHVYAPLSDVTVNGTPDFYGWIIGKTLTLKGNTQLHYDETRDNKALYKISLVQ